MKLVFNLAFDGEPWPGPLGAADASTPPTKRKRGRGASGGPAAGSGQAVIGESWVGPLGLLTELETQLGLPNLAVGAGERDAALVPAVLETAGFWSRSAEVDPLGVATTLRRWRDHLVLHGWDPMQAAAGASVGKATKAGTKATKRTKAAASVAAGTEDRLAALARLTTDILPGLVDRIRAVRGELDVALTEDGPEGPGRLEIDALVLLDQPREALPLLWQQVLDRLAQLGVPVTDADVEAPKRKRSDLAAALAPGFAPKGDGSLQLVRPVGPQAAAEVVAAWLAERADAGDLEGTVILGGDALLDAALRQQGLPTTGAPSASDGDPLGAVLPLVIQLGWGPVDPQVALDLVMLPASPVPRGLAFRLAGALGQWPAVGSPDWDEAMAEWLGKQEGDYLERVTARLARLFQVDAPGETYPASALVERARLVEKWARGRQLGAMKDRARTPDLDLDDDAGSSSAAPASDADSNPGADTDAWRWDAVIADCVSLRRVVEAAGAPTLGAAQVEDLMETAGVGSGAGGRFPAEVGLARLASPGQLVGPARRVIWWGFTRAAAFRPYTPPFSAAELAQAAAQGARLPEPGRVVQWDRQTWLRPFGLTTGELILVCPQLDDALEPAFPHPVWDEVVAPLARAAVAKLTVPTPGGVAPSRTVKRLGLPTPAARWSVAGAANLPPLPRLSPSAVGTLVGCPLAYALSRDARLEARLPVVLTIENSTYGSITHHLYEQLLGAFVGKTLPKPDAAARQAGALFDAELPRLATTLCLPGQESARATLRRRVTEGAAALVTQLGAQAGTVAAVEQPVERLTPRRSFGGIADLQLDGPPALIDYKWTLSRYLAPQLAAGTAYQLAIYAWCVGTGRGPLPPVAYFSIQGAELLTTSPDRFPGATAVKGPDLRVTLQALDRALDEVIADRAAGTVPCPGTPEDEEVGDLKDGWIDEAGCLRLPTGCNWCTLNDLCQKEAAR